LPTHACGSCIPMYLDLLSFAQTYYSGYAHKVHVVFFPDFAIPLWDIYKKLLTPSVTKLLYIHGTQKRELKRELEKDIDPSQLSPRYGGYKKEGVDLSTMRSTAPNAFLANPVSLHLKEKNITDFCSIDWPQIVNIIDDSFPSNKLRRSSKYD